MGNSVSFWCVKEENISAEQGCVLYEVQLAIGTVIVMDKAATSNPFLSLLHFQAGINLSLVSDNKDLFDMENIKCVARVTERQFHATTSSQHAFPSPCFPVSVHITKQAEKDWSKEAFGALEICSYSSKGTVESWAGDDRAKWYISGVGWVLSPLQHPLVLAESCCFKQEMLSLFQINFIVLTCKFLQDYFT